MIHLKWKFNWYIDLLFQIVSKENYIFVVLGDGKYKYILSLASGKSNEIGVRLYNEMLILIS